MLFWLQVACELRPACGLFLCHVTVVVLLATVAVVVVACDGIIFCPVCCCCEDGEEVMQDDEGVESAKVCDFCVRYCGWLSTAGTTTMMVR